jgi:glycosyltransferase involved in cell wall biosynthesis
MIVGVISSRFNHYSYVRNLVGLVPGVDYVRVTDLFGRAEHTLRRVNKLAHRQLMSPHDLSNQFYDFNLNNVDLIHFYNMISYGRTPWVGTFETILPRFTDLLDKNYPLKRNLSTFPRRWEIHQAFEALVGPSCKRIIAMSECAANLERDLLQGFCSYKKELENKMVVIHPPQTLLISDYSEKPVDLKGRIKFLFVGISFFRKGGREVLDAFKELRDKNHYDIDLTIVSALRIDNYASGESVEDVSEAKKIIAENKDWITYYPQLSNKDVLALMKESHVGLLPTYSDSYGYSMLEFQASGCPVISTNIRVLPEINDNQKGWLIEVPKDPSGEAIHITPSDRQELSAAIRQGLEKSLHEIFANPTIITEKGEKAIQYIRDFHSPADFAARMNQIYLESIG